MGVDDNFAFRISLVCVALAALITVVASQVGDPPEEREMITPGDEGWVSLFEGESLRGWKQNDSADWNVVNGFLEGTNGSLLNRWCWVDFDLQFRFQGRGHLLFRVGSDQMGHIGFGQPGYRLDLERGVLSTAEGKRLGSPPKGWPTGGWHLLAMNVQQGWIRITIDGEPVLEASSSDSPLKGRIGIEADGEELRVAYCRVRPLGRELLTNIPAENYYCYVCHVNFEYDDPLVTIHDDFECADCHGPSLAHRSDEDNVTPPDILFRRPQVDARCLECHVRHEAREAPADKTVSEQPICTDCHGNHRVLGLGDL
jgi:predicted CXXCH cytochrome family protein